MTPTRNIKDKNIFNKSPFVPDFGCNRQILISFNDCDDICDPKSLLKRSRNFRPSPWILPKIEPETKDVGNIVNVETFPQLALPGCSVNSYAKEVNK